MKAARDQAEGIVKQAERELGHENTRSLDNFVASYFPRVDSKGFGDADFRVSGLPIPKQKPFEPTIAGQPKEQVDGDGFTRQRVARQRPKGR
jgi:hypothetical protein